MNAASGFGGVAVMQIKTKNNKLESDTESRQNKNQGKI
jgi:hypothetical protein